MLIKIPRGWEIPEREATPEHVFMNRREVLAAAGFFGMEGLLRAANETRTPFPAKRNADFVLDRPITEEWAATGYNNFYEFDQADKTAVKGLVGNFKTEPWSFQVKGLVNKPATFDLAEL